MALAGGSTEVGQAGGLSASACCGSLLCLQPALLSAKEGV